MNWIGVVAVVGSVLAGTVAAIAGVVYLRRVIRERVATYLAFRDPAQSISLAQAEKELAEGQTVSLEVFLHSEDV